ncbi:MAG TPA: acyl-CoA dehydrogenase family protein [Solirubrobacterales bacterium]
MAATVIKDTGERAVLPPFTGEHEELRATIRRWVEREVAPHVAEWDEAGEFPRSLYERAGELGFLGLKYPVELGGQGGDYVHDAVWAEEIAAAGAGGGVGAGLGAHTGIATPPIYRFGTPEQHERFLRPAIAGRKIGALGITEPGAGSDVAAIRTRAERRGDVYVVNGSKTFITNGARADFLVCACRTKPEGGHQGISFLILERDMPGYEVTRKLEKLGWRSSDTAELSFTDVEVPAENLLGPEHGGFYLIMANFQWERLLMALGAVGAMRHLLERTLAYAREREAFGRPIGRFQAIRHQLAEVGLKLETSRALAYHALREFVRPEAERREAIAAGDWGNPAITAGLDEVTKAKLYTQRAAVDVADICLQIHGGYGYMREYGIERALRDLRLGPIGGGTDEIMREILGKRLGL